MEGEVGHAPAPRRRLAQDHLLGLRSTLQRLTEAFLTTTTTSAPPPSSSSLAAPLHTSPPTLHGYGQVNVERARKEVRSSVRGLCTMLEHYKALSVHQEKLLPRYLSLLRDRSQLSAQVDGLKNALALSIRRAEDHLAKRGSRLTGEGEGSRQQLFIRNLQSVAEAHGLQLFAFDTSDEMGESSKTVSASISGQHFLVDVHITLQGHVAKANVTFTSSAGDASSEFSRPEVDEEISRILRMGDLKRFDEVIGILNELDVMYTENPDTNLKRALWTLEDDLVELHRRECANIEKECDLVLLQERHGIPIWQCEGLFLHYHTSPGQLLLNQAAGERLLNSFGALITLREGRTQCKLPTTSQVDSLFSDLPIIAPIDELDINSEGDRVHFDLMLKPPVVMFTDTLQQISSHVWGATAPARPSHELQASSFASLQQILCATSLNGRCERQGVSYVYSGYEERGTVVHHISFTHIKQLLPILRLLRQQLVFNELLLSCFSEDHLRRGYVPSATLNGPAPDPPPQGDEVMDLESAYALDGCETAMAEIAGVSRYAFSVTLLDPISQNLISIFITVGPGGTITAVPHTSLLDAQPFSGEYVTELLTRSQSIPLTLKHLLHGKHGLANNPHTTQAC